MKALLLLGIMVIAVPLAFLSPYIGVLTYIWMAITRPHEWAYVQTAQYSMMVGAATLLGYFVFEALKRPPRLGANLLMVLVWVQATLGTYLGYNIPNAEIKYIEFTKVIVIGLLISALVDNESRVRWLLLVILVSVAMVTFKDFVGSIIHMGNVKLTGPGGSFEDNNDYALLLVMATPMAYYFARSETIRWLRWAVYGMALMTCITILFTYSRGGFLGLCTIGLVMALKTKYKVTGLAVLVLAGMLVLYLSPAKVLDRIGTIKTAQEQDASAQGRLKAWDVSLKIMRDYPWTGIGMKNILLIYGKYGDPTEAKVAHNSYLQCAVDAGIPALIFFLMMIAVTFWRLRVVRHIFQARSPDNIVINYTHGLETALYGYCVSAFFLSQYAFEILYMIVPLVASLKVIARAYEKEAQLRELVDAAPHKSMHEPSVPAPAM
ncbi:MAG TPA: putative O-glycosylation ligase, exosortase A system-associated [Blastocatellia bacterium]|nr:putative O-glycosylation ligase, exosortase A system-associated [Blastocatellia bacterium]